MALSRRIAWYRQEEAVHDHPDDLDREQEPPGETQVVPPQTSDHGVERREQDDRDELSGDAPVNKAPCEGSPSLGVGQEKAIDQPVVDVSGFQSPEGDGDEQQALLSVPPLPGDRHSGPQAPGSGSGAYNIVRPH